MTAAERQISLAYQQLYVLRCFYIIRFYQFAKAYGLRNSLEKEAGTDTGLFSEIAPTEKDPTGHKIQGSFWGAIKGFFGGGRSTAQVAPSTSAQTQKAGDDYSSKYLSNLGEKARTQIEANLDAVSSEEKIISPIKAGHKGVISSHLGEKGHNAGIDIAVPESTPIVAVKSGKVIEAYGEKVNYKTREECNNAKPQNCLGPHIIIQHKDGTQSQYAHGSKLSVQFGEDVTQGQTIMEAGNYGHSSDTHLHFEVRKRVGFSAPVDNQIDPEAEFGRDNGMSLEEALKSGVSGASPPTKEK